MEKIFEKEIKLGIPEFPLDKLNILENQKNLDSSVNNPGLENCGKFKWKDYFWKCEIEECSVEINELDVLREHYQEVHESPIKYNCNECPKSFMKLAAFINHVHLHKPNLKFCCIFCSEFFCDSLHLYKHQSSAHKKLRLLICLYCSRLSNTTGQLRIHKETHGSVGREKLYSCDLCGGNYSSKHTLREHITRHFKGKNCICDICGLTFRDQSLLNRHQLNHIEDKPYKCEQCQEAFKTPNLLSVHIIDHGKPKPEFSCDDCDKRFLSRLGLKEHLRIHSAETPWTCEFCDKKFRQHGSYKIHRRVHTRERPYSCPDCDRTFPNKQNLNKHSKTKHYRCDICSDSFNAKHKLASHKEQHTATENQIKVEKEEFRCGICGKLFLKKCSLKSHLIVHSEDKPFKCSYCKDTFKAQKGLTKHEKSHFVVREFFCETCKRYFPRKSSWQDHIRNH